MLLPNLLSPNSARYTPASNPIGTAMTAVRPIKTSVPSIETAIPPARAAFPVGRVTRAGVPVRNWTLRAVAPFLTTSNKMLASGIIARVTHRNPRENAILSLNLLQLGVEVLTRLFLQLP